MPRTLAVVLVLGLLAAGGCKEPAAALSELHRLVLSGDAQGLAERLAGVDAVDVLVRDTRNWTPLHHAALLDQMEAVQALLDHARRQDLEQGTSLFEKTPKPGLRRRLVEARTK